MTLFLKNEIVAVHTFFFTLPMQNRKAWNTCSLGSMRPATVAGAWYGSKAEDPTLPKCDSPLTTMWQTSSPPSRRKSGRVPWTRHSGPAFANRPPLPRIPWSRSKSNSWAPTTPWSWRRDGWTRPPPKCGPGTKPTMPWKMSLEKRTSCKRR